MKITVIRGSEVGPDLADAWARIQQGRFELASPYLCPEFTQSVAAVRADVFVAVLEEANRPVGFFPFQRGRMGMGKAVGGPLCDFQGVIARPEAQWSVAELLKACRLNTFEFTHLPLAQAPFRPYCLSVAESHFIDLSEGFAGYQAYLKAQGSGLLKEVRAKRRRLAGYGDVQFEPHTREVGVLQQLMSWKSRQYQRSGLVDVFRFGWVRELLERIHATQTGRFSGMLSALRVGGRLVAAHMGMRSPTVWNWWFPRHDEQFAKCSPGILLRIYVAEAAPAFGVTRVDLGLGDESTYKPRLRSGGIPLAAGRVERPCLASALRCLRRETEAWVRQSPLLPLVRAPGRLLTRWERRWRFQ